MIKRFLFLQSRFLVLLSVLVMFVSGCIPPTTCTAESVNANIYKAELLRQPNIIFEYAHPLTPEPSTTSTPDLSNTPLPTPTITPTGTPLPNPVQGARYAAFNYLIEETERWSAVQEIKFSDSTEAQIIITFIGPELLQAVSLGDALNERNTTLDFNSQARAALDSIAMREELLFMMAVISPHNKTGLNNHVIKFDTTTLKLKDAEGLELSPGHIESNLGEPINVSSAAVFGYFGYPLVKQVEGNCKQVLDPTYNTKIVITLSDILVDNVHTGPYSWTIAYMPLIDLKIPPPLPDFIVPQNYDQSIISPLVTPPNEIQLTPQQNEIQHNALWQNYARFIWYIVTLGN